MIKTKDSYFNLSFEDFMVFSTILKNVLANYPITHPDYKKACSLLTTLFKNYRTTATEFAVTSIEPQTLISILDFHDPLTTENKITNSHVWQLTKVLLGLSDSFVTPPFYITFEDSDDRQIKTQRIPDCICTKYDDIDDLTRDYFASNQPFVFRYKDECYKIVNI